MRKIYSLILLFSFLTGVVQPAIPLLEYHIFKQSIIELLCENRDVPESDCDGVCYLSKQIQESQEKSSDGVASRADFYPGATLYGHPAVPDLYPGESERFPALMTVTIHRASPPNIPPPRLG